MDGSSTRWGWENDVEPGTFLTKRQRGGEAAGSAAGAKVGSLASRRTPQVVLTVVKIESDARMWAAHFDVNQHRSASIGSRCLGRPLARGSSVHARPAPALHFRPLPMTTRDAEVKRWRDEGRPIRVPSPLAPLFLPARTPARPVTHPRPSRQYAPMQHPWLSPSATASGSAGEYAGAEGRAGWWTWCRRLPPC